MEKKQNTNFTRLSCWDLHTQPLSFCLLLLLLFCFSSRWSSSSPLSYIVFNFSILIGRCHYCRGAHDKLSEALKIFCLFVCYSRSDMRKGCFLFCLVFFFFLLLEMSCFSIIFPWSLGEQNGVADVCLRLEPTLFDIMLHAQCSLRSTYCSGSTPLCGDLCMTSCLSFGFRLSPCWPRWWTDQ